MFLSLFYIYLVTLGLSLSKTKDHNQFTKGFILFNRLCYYSIGKKTEFSFIRYLSQIIT